MARPEKAATERRTAHLPPVRLTQTELLAVEAQAKAAGVSVSELIRQLATTGKITPPLRMTALDRLLADLNRSGNNLNQIAKRLNAGRDAPPDLGIVLHQFHTVLEKIGRAYGA